MDIASSRARKVLSSVIKDYIVTAEPVSSRAVAAGYCPELSPATIRNIMAELESAGYLVQPHTSAGRVPTDKSFRFYVNCLLECEEPTEESKSILRRGCSCSLPIEAALGETARTLSSLSRCAGLMFVPRRDRFVIKRISVVAVDRTRMMVMLVSNFGFVETRIVDMGEGIGKLDVEKISNYLNSISGGLTLRELRARIVEEMRNVKNMYDELLARALSLGAMVLEEDGRAEQHDLYVEGKVNVLDQPEFRDDFTRMKRLFALFEERSLLVDLLDKSTEEAGTRIYFGSEGTVAEFDGLSFVTAPYMRDGSVIGTLGVVGPVRMDYSRIIPLVGYTAGILSGVFYRS